MLQTKTLTFSERCSPRTRRGQSIIVALLVLLLLGVAGALFVTIVARNLLNARHANRVVTADQYARAGITFADAQLSTSLDGADWRPPLQFQLATPPTGTRELARYNAAKANLLSLTSLPYSDDPDKEYLEAGYARYNTGAGRFLLRVTYDPVNVGQLDVPPGKYLKIESIGREGLIESIDPTTYTNNRSTDRTQAYQVAYKPIGITDYARFETNPDNRSDIANLGVISQQYTQDSSNDGGIATPGVYDFVSGSAPAYKLYPVVTTYGASDAYLKDGMTPPNFYLNPTAGTGQTAPNGFMPAPGDGSIHANMPLRFFGKNVVYLSTGGANAPLFQDGIEVVGNLLLDSYSPSANLDNTLPTGGTGTPVYQQASLVLNPTVTNGKTDLKYYVAPSNSVGGFNTQGGLIRDGSMQNDVNGQPRGIKRLEPPLMDAQDSASRLPRYKVIAMTSAPRPNLKNVDGTAYVPAANAPSPSQFGYGNAIYINNTADIQADSSSVGGGTTLTSEWLNRTPASQDPKAKGNWNGQLYSPPGVSIILGQQITPPANASVGGTFGIRMVRSGGDNFVGPDGVTNAGPKMDVSYADLDTDPTGAASDNNIIIYAEGNVRVRGILSPNEGAATATSKTFVPRHITIITGGTAYIEGNLLKGTADSSISVLAHDYVCVNTTQFLAGANVESRTDGKQNPDTPYLANALTLDDSHSLLQEFSFGLTGNDTPAKKYGGTNLALYISVGPAGSGSTKADIDIFPAYVNPPIPSPLMPTFSTLTHLTYDLSTLVPPLTGQSALFGATATDLFRLSVNKDAGAEGDPSAAQDVALERVAVLPMDIRIEAVLYAQTRSFFVIPGDWFNGKHNDTIDQFAGGTTRPDLNGVPARSTDYTNRSRFPMYGQPIDLKITIDGAVSEARPADISAQSAWMTRWGWIPQFHGSLTGETAGHVAYQPGGGATPTPANVPAVGLQIIYNPQAGYPYNPGDNTASPAVVAHYLRSDIYGRPLPFSPMLPVSTGLLYSGDSSEPPLLQ